MLKLSKVYKYRIMKCTSCFNFVVLMCEILVLGRVAGRHMCPRTWISGDPLPGHHASSNPGFAVGAVVGWPWPASPGCSPPAGAPGPRCPFPRCAAAVAASSLAHAAYAAQSSDWTSRQRETSSANTHSEQPCRHDNLSIQRSIQPSLALFLHHQTPKSNQTGETGRKAGKLREKFLYFFTLSEDDIM